jgi:hypothetical protein
VGIAHKWDLMHLRKAIDQPFIEIDP